MAKGLNTGPHRNMNASLFGCTHEGEVGVGVVGVLPYVLLFLIPPPLWVCHCSQFNTRLLYAACIKTKYAKLKKYCLK